jgi:hypothetical protein
MIRIGLISDTHGLLRPEAVAFLRGSDRIIHAGDICEPWVLEELARLAPVTAVRGNNDKGAWAQALQENETLRLGTVAVHVIHDLKLLMIEPAATGIRVMVSGHSHKPSITERDGVMFVNPGSAGPRRFKLPVSAAELLIVGDTVSARLVELLPHAVADESAHA